MKRTMSATLDKWYEKNSYIRKPLVLAGCSKTGKTWLVENFCEDKDIISIDFSEKRQAYDSFEQVHDDYSLIKCLRKISGRKLDSNEGVGKTVVFLDNIQECPPAFRCLSAPYKTFERYPVIGAGCLSDIPDDIDRNTEVCWLYPCSFEEFLLECYGLDLPPAEALEEPQLHEKYIEAFHTYLAVGGMPTCIQVWTDTGDLEKVREEQKRIIQLYKGDLLKTDPDNNPRFHFGKKANAILESLPRQLLKENCNEGQECYQKGNQKFMFSVISLHAERKTMEKPLNYLISSKIILPVYNDKQDFIPFLFDTGLLGALADVDITDIADTDSENSFPFKQVLYQNFVVQELHETFHLSYTTYKHKDVHYRKDFLRINRTDSVPYRYGIQFGSKSSDLPHHYKMSKDNWIAFSEEEFSREDKCLHVPMYMISELLDILA